MSTVDRQPPPSQARHAIVLVLLVALALRLFLLLILGPRLSYDAATGYIPYADLILSGGDWIRDAGLSTAAVPVTAFRMPGYPAAIALAKLIAGSDWPWLIATIQIIGSMAAIGATMLLALALAAQRLWVAVLTGLLVATGQTLGTDTAIQTDSLAASSLAVFAVLSARGALLRRPLGPAKALALGLLPAAAFALRENTMVTVLALLPFAMAWIGRSHRALPARAGLFLVVLLPLAAGAALQADWNFHRSGGRAFITTGPQIILLQALMHAQWSGENVLDRDDAIDHAALAQLAARDHPNGFLTQKELWDINQALHDSGADAVEIARRIGARYRAAWAGHPAGMLRASLRNLSLAPLILPGSGLRHDPNVPADNTGAPAPVPAEPGLAFRLLSIVFAAVSLSISLGLLLSPLAALWRRVAGRGPFTGADWFRLGALAAVLWFLAIHAAVHFENRFLAPVEPLAIAAGISAIAGLFARRQRA